MKPIDLARDIIRPTLAWLEQLGGPKSTPEAGRFLLAIAATESNCEERCQVLNNGNPGPARSYWQFEQLGVRGVLMHAVSAAMAARVCRELDVRAEHVAIWRCMEGNDKLACAFARLLVWTDPAPLPVTLIASYDAYSRKLWRPGKPSYERYQRAWSMSEQVMKELAWH